MAHRSQRLFIREINNKIAVNVPVVLLENGRLSAIVNKATGDSQSINFLRSLLEISTQFTFPGNWRHVGREIESSLPRLCGVVCEQKAFTKRCESAVRLVAAILGRRGEASDDVRRLLLRLGDWFFEFPANSFLHNQFVGLMRAVDAAHKLDAELIREMQLCHRIIDVYRNREDNLSSCYWGQLARLADIVGPYVEQAGADPQVWRIEVVARNAEKQRIMADSCRRWRSALPKTEWNSEVVCVVVAFVIFIASIILVTVPGPSWK
jgi:hypothetical protein